MRRYEFLYRNLQAINFILETAAADGTVLDVHWFKIVFFDGTSTNTISTFQVNIFACLKL